jgi:hypothetical protein
MTGASLPSSRSGTRIASIAWRLALVLFLFTSENLWLDRWLRIRGHRLLSLVPEALSGVWFLVFVIGSVALILLVVCQILLVRDRSVHFSTKLGVGIALLIVTLLSVDWVRVTNGQPSIFRLQSSQKKHAVTLKWNASTSPVIGYNVYRRNSPQGGYLRINPSLIPGLSYTDDTVQSGITYYYVARAVDAQNHESINSNESSATVP